MDNKSNIWEGMTAISTALLVLTAIGALGLACSQIEEARDEARIVHLQEMVQQFSTPPVSDSLRLLASKRIDQKQKVLLPLSPDDAPEEMYDLMNFFETMALLTERGYLNERDVWHEFGYWLFPFYADARPVLEKEQREDSVMFSNFSRLMAALDQLENKNGGKLNHPSTDDLYSFYYSEVSEPPGRRQRKSTKRRKEVLK